MKTPEQLAEEIAGLIDQRNDTEDGSRFRHNFPDAWLASAKERITAIIRDNYPEQS